MQAFENNNSVKNKALSKSVPKAIIPSFTTQWDKFVEFLTLVYDICSIVISVPFILAQEAATAWYSWKGINMTKLDRLPGKVVLITGANSGIGECLAKYFYLAGCQVILAARRRNELERVRDSLVAMPSSIKTHRPSVLELDLSDRKSISDLVGLVVTSHGHVDILVNNAGVFNHGYVLDTVMDVDEKIMAVNYLGTLALTKVVGRHMVERGQGHICFVSSVLGKMTVANSQAYSASKHALQTLADSLRLEIEPEGVNVTIISPSYVNTDISVNALNATGEKYGVVTKEIETGFSPDYVSERIFKAVVNEEKDVIIAPLLHRGAIYLRHFLASVFFLVTKGYGKPTVQY